jgi:ParB family chromosome partitioning protein
MTDSDVKMTLVFDKRIDPEFGSFVQERLTALHDEYRSRKPEE